MPCRWKLSRRHSLCKRRSRCTRASSRSVRGSALAEFLEMPGNVHIVASASGATPTPKFWLYPHCLGKNRRPACSVPCRDSTNDCIQRVASGYCICNAIRLACIASTTFSKKNKPFNSFTSYIQYYTNSTRSSSSRQKLSHFAPYRHQDSREQQHPFLLPVLENVKNLLPLV